MISMIAAMARNRVIGKDNALLWRMKADMRRFVELTTGKPVIVGRKTYLSFGGKPLKNRKNIVLTADLGFNANGAVVVHNPDQALQAAEDSNEIMVIGGSVIYELFLPLAERLYLTLIDADYQGDSYFPEYEQTFKERSRQCFEADEDNPHPYCFVTLER